MAFYKCNTFVTKFALSCSCNGSESCCVHTAVMSMCADVWLLLLLLLLLLPLTTRNFNTKSSLSFKSYGALRLVIVNTDVSKPPRLLQVSATTGRHAIIFKNSRTAVITSPYSEVPFLSILIRYLPRRFFTSSLSYPFLRRPCFFLLRYC
jgi:hypothetical protein